MTPVKYYPLGNICVVCGFSFVTKRVDESGNIIIDKCLEKKLRITPERRATLHNVCNLSEDIRFPSDMGVCQKCFHSMDRVLKAEKEALETRLTFDRRCPGQFLYQFKIVDRVSVHYSVDETMIMIITYICLS